MIKSKTEPSFVSNPSRTSFSTKPRSNLPDGADNENIAFWEYHQQHPEVYEKFKITSFETKRKGFKRFSARGVFQIMRWLRGGEIKVDGYKLNNNYTPYYVRLLEQEYPEFIGFFEKRKTKYDTSNPQAQQNENHWHHNRDYR